MEREVGRREGKVGRRGIIVGGMILSLLIGCNNGAIEELEKKNSYFESVVKIGQGFQEIFGIFGNAVGEALGFSAVKSTDNRGIVGEHFKKIGEGLTATKNSLNELSSKISEAKNADGSTIETVKVAIKDANDVFDKLISFLTKFAEVAKGASGTNIGDSSGDNAAGADKTSVEIIVENVKKIIEVANKSGVKIKPGTPGDQVAAGAATAPAALLRSDSQANAGAGDKLAAEVSKADPWAMIDKIKNATVQSTTDLGGSNNEVGALVTGTDNSSNDAVAATNADLAAAVALKAMTQGGKFNASNDSGVAVKAAAANAVNKVLGVLDEIIRRTVAKNLEKVREAVKGIQYSETIGTNATETSTSNK